MTALTRQSRSWRSAQVERSPFTSRIAGQAFPKVSSRVSSSHFSGRTMRRAMAAAPGWVFRSRVVWRRRRAGGSCTCRAKAVGAYSRFFCRSRKTFSNRRGPSTDRRGSLVDHAPWPGRAKRNAGQRCLVVVQIVIVVEEIAQPIRVAEEVGYARDDDVGLEQKRRADVQRRLIVKEVLPPAARNDLRHDDGHQLA